MRLRFSVSGDVIQSPLCFCIRGCRRGLLGPQSFQLLAYHVIGEHVA